MIFARPPGGFNWVVGQEAQEALEELRLKSDVAFDRIEELRKELSMKATDMGSRTPELGAGFFHYGCKIADGRVLSLLFQLLGDQLIVRSIQIH